MNPFRRGTIGAPERTRIAPTRAELIKQARHNRAWTEVEAAALERRARGLVVTSGGETLVSYRADPQHNQASPLFFVVEDGVVTFYERFPS